jgi:hypothetical protein
MAVWHAGFDGRATWPIWGFKSSEGGDRVAYFYEQGDITVDQHFARFGDKAYAINKINSVEVRTHQPPESTAWLWLGFIGACFGIAVLDNIGDGESPVANLFIAGIAFLLTYFFYKDRKRPAHHSLFLVMSNSEAQAFRSTELAEVRSLRAAVEEAIVRSSERQE